MPTPRIVRSIPFWVLGVGSAAVTVVGTLISLQTIETMATTVADGTATGVEVYAGQAWVSFGGPLTAAGIVGLVITLALAVIPSLLPKPAVEVVEPIEWSEFGDDAAIGEEPDVEVSDATPAPVEAEAAPEAPATDPTEAPASR